MNDEPIIPTETLAHRLENLRAELFNPTTFAADQVVVRFADSCLVMVMLLVEVNLRHQCVALQEGERPVDRRQANTWIHGARKQVQGDRIKVPTILRDQIEERTPLLRHAMALGPQGRHRMDAEIVDRNRGCRVHTTPGLTRARRCCHRRAWPDIDLPR